jgi:glucosylceramidase
MQNEPHFEPSSYAGMRLNPSARRRLLGDHVGPLFAGRHPGVRLLEWDHNWINTGSVLAVLDDPNARRYVGGIAWHCYEGYPWEQSRVHEFYPHLDAYMTECTGGGWEPKHADPLTETAGGLLVESLRAWAKGIVLWNVILDENSGPRIGGCPNCRPVVTVDSHTGEATRNPEYYALAHFSRFVRPGAVRVASNVVAGLDNVAFRNADDGSVVLVVVNPSRASLPFTAGRAECLFDATLPARSIATYVWSAASQCRPNAGP